MKSLAQRVVTHYQQNATTPFRIGITGYGRAGKDTTAGILSNKIHWFPRTRVVISPLAAPLKEALNHLVDTGDESEAFNTEAKNAPAPHFCGATFREVMISFGDWARDLNPWFFIDLLEETFQFQGVLIVPDVRRQNELERMDYVIRVTRPGVGPAADHPTEGELDGAKVDWEIVNDGDVEDLTKKIDEMLYAQEGQA